MVINLMLRCVFVLLLGCLGFGVSAQSVGAGALKGLADAIGEIADGEIAKQRQLELARQRHELEMERLRYQAEVERQRKEAAEAARQREQLAREEREAIESRVRGVSGSGFFVDESHIATNFHVTSDFPRLRVRTLNGQLLHARLVASDREHDLALLQVSLRASGLRVASSGAVKGERVFTVGYPVPGVQGQESKVTEGIVNSLSASSSRQDWFQFSAQIQPGNSGGPVVNGLGEVIGVAVAQANALKYLSGAGSLPQNVNYAIKASYLLDLMARAGVKPSMRTAKKGAALKHVDASTVMVLADDPFALGGTAGAPEGQRTPEELLVDRAHPNWRALVKTADFNEWHRLQPPEVRRLSDSPRSQDAIRLLESYKHDRGVR